jgi:hypothetical protein
MYDRRRLVERLQKALRLGRWSEVQAVVEQLRGSGPVEHSDWRRRLLPIIGREEDMKKGMEGVRGQGSGAREKQPVAGDGQRFVLWVDAVGGFLVCMADRVVVGQSTPDPAGNHDVSEAATDERGADDRTDVPILGDLSRRHAVIRRDAEGYWVEPLRETRLDGRTVGQPTTLDDGRVIELGGVRLRFRRPHPLSATARLEPVSFHRTQPATDGVLLMADTCILSRDPSSHVMMPDLEGQIVLYRQGSGLACSGPGNLEIDGKRHSRRGPVGLGSRVVGENFSFTLEAV